MTGFVFGLSRLLTGVAALLGREMWRMSIFGWMSEAITDKPSPRCWPPEAGDDVEMWSRYTNAWFPAVVTARSETGGWPSLDVRLKGNGVGDSDVKESEIRPVRRLDAARREHPDCAYEAYDADNAKHLRECNGCLDCEGLSEHYRECACGNGRRLHVGNGACSVCETPRCHGYNLYHGACPVCMTPSIPVE